VGRSIAEVLRSVALYSGGAVATLGELADARRAHDLLRSDTPLASVAGLVLTFLSLLLFTPIARSWAAISLALAARRRQARETQPFELTRFDVAAVLADWGFQPGQPRGARQAGTPAARKPFEPGDNLSASNPATLVPLTSFGRRLHLPPRRPQVRQRHVTRAMQALVVADLAPSVVVPAASPNPTKVVGAAIAIEMIARGVWQQSGWVDVRVPPMTDERSWGPRASEDDAVDLRRFLSEALSRDGLAAWRPELVVPDEVGPGHIAFVVSDCLDLEVNVLRRFCATCVERDVSLRVVRIVDPAESTLLALGYDVITGTVRDRSAWSPSDAIAASDRLNRELATVIERYGGQFVVMRTTDTDLAIANLLLAPSFLSP
jgi:hypothetical protein